MMVIYLYNQLDSLQLTSMDEIDIDVQLVLMASHSTPLRGYAHDVVRELSVQIVSLQMTQAQLAQHLLNSVLLVSMVMSLYEMDLMTVDCSVVLHHHQLLVNVQFVTQYLVVIDVI